MHLKEQTSKENNTTACTQTVQPMLGFTLAEVCQAQNNPTLTVPQLLEIEPCRDYTETPLQMLDSLYVMQPKDSCHSHMRLRNWWKNFVRKK